MKGKKTLEAEADPNGAVSAPAVGQTDESTELQKPDAVTSVQTDEAPKAPAPKEEKAEAPAPEAEKTEPKVYSNDDLFDSVVSEGENCILECRSLSKMYSKFTALFGVNLRIPTGGIVGLLGPNGSGKTTLIKLAMGMLHPTTGEILIDGRKPDYKTRAITAYLPDANYLCDWMRVDQQIAYYCDFFPDFRKDKAEEMLSRLGIGLKQKIKALSKGNKEKLGLILTMSRTAKLYILDEPIAGVDPAARDYILNTILASKPEDATIFLCTHLIADIEPVLTHAIFLRNGQIALDSPVEEVRKKTGKSLDELFREVFKW